MSLIVNTSQNVKCVFKSVNIRINSEYCQDTSPLRNGIKRKKSYTPFTRLEPTGGSLGFRSRGMSVSKNCRESFSFLGFILSVGRQTP